MDAGSTVTFVAIAAFGIDRIVSGTLFLLSTPRSWRAAFPDPELVSDPHEKAVAARKRKLAYFLFAAVLSAPVVFYGNIGLFSLILKSGSETAGPSQWQFFDKLLTTLVFVGGAERIGGWIRARSSSASEAGGSGVIEVRGSLAVESGGQGGPTAKCPACSAELEAGSSYCGHCGTRVAGAARTA